MDLEIKVLEATIEKLLNESKLPPEVKRLMLMELVGKMAVQANLAVQEQSKEVNKKDAESAQSN
ncbi:MAG: hypothetical protein IJF07_08680 [Lachnospiraceae bacterium]|nr:hypothetical protein [Lachnospiraceae bacterium]